MPSGGHVWVLGNFGWAMRGQGYENGARPTFTRSAPSLVGVYVGLMLEPRRSTFARTLGFKALKVIHDYEVSRKVSGIKLI